MRLFKLIIKEIKQQLRDIQGLVFSIAFPIVLTLVLGFALSGMFSDDSNLSSIHALYRIEDDSPVSQSFLKDFVPAAESFNFFLTEEKDEKKAIEAVKMDKTSCYINVSGKGIDITSREGTGLNAQLAETIIKSFVKGYHVYTSVAKVNPEALSVLSPKDETIAPEYVKSLSLQRDKTPRALDYYAITMITLIIMYAAPGGTAVISEERRLKTLPRLLVSPVTKGEILVSKITALSLATFLQVGIVFLFDKLVLKTEWGDHPAAVMALLFSQIIMVVSVGVGTAYLFKESSTGFSVLNTIIPFMIFLGGGYVNLELLGIGGWIEKISYISPVKWLNQTLLQIIYASDFTNFLTTIAICLSISVIFLILTVMLSRKEAHA